jgi:hypothetical protein
VTAGCGPVGWDLGLTAVILTARMRSPLVPVHGLHRDMAQSPGFCGPRAAGAFACPAVTPAASMGSDAAAQPTI